MTEECRDHGLVEDELLVGTGDVTGSASSRESRLRMLCGNLFSLPILNKQQTNKLVYKDCFTVYQCKLCSSTVLSDSVATAISV